MIYQKMYSRELGYMQMKTLFIALLLIGKWGNVEIASELRYNLHGIVKWDNRRLVTFNTIKTKLLSLSQGGSLFDPSEYECY